MDVHVHVRQTTRVLRFRAAMICTHLGFSRWPFTFRSRRCAYVVDLYVHRGVAHLAFVRLDPFDELVAVSPVPLRLSVY